jgi:hypothetical protein
MPGLFIYTITIILSFFLYRGCLHIYEDCLLLCTNLNVSPGLFYGNMDG